jgi:hypothetical protein
MYKNLFEIKVWWHKLGFTHIISLFYKVVVQYWLKLRCLYITLKTDFWPSCTKSIWLMEWWMLGCGCHGIGYVLCVINSSHTSRLTFSELCTVVDRLKMCTWLFRSVWTFFETLTLNFIGVYFSLLLTQHFS